METLDDSSGRESSESLQFPGACTGTASCIMDYEESFYYYVMTQKTETWNRSVGWYSFAGNHVTFRKLTINSGSKPLSGAAGKPNRNRSPGETEKREMKILPALSKKHLVRIFIPAFR